MRSCLAVSPWLSARGEGVSLHQGPASSPHAHAPPVPHPPPPSPSPSPRCGNQDGAEGGSYFHIMLGRVRGCLHWGAGCREKRCFMQGCSMHKPLVWPAWGSPGFSCWPDADEKKQDAARLLTALATDVTPSPFAGLLALRANGLLAKRVPSSPYCGFRDGLGLGPEAASSGLWQRSLAMWLFPHCRRKAGCEASCGT